MSPAAASAAGAAATAVRRVKRGSTAADATTQPAAAPQKPWMPGGHLDHRSHARAVYYVYTGRASCLLSEGLQHARTDTRAGLAGWLAGWLADIADWLDGWLTLLTGWPADSLHRWLAG